MPISNRYAALEQSTNDELQLAEQNPELNMGNQVDKGIELMVVLPIQDPSNKQLTEPREVTHHTRRKSGKSPLTESIVNG